jgi:hypothetical protein
MPPQQRIQAALQAFDLENAKDPVAGRALRQADRVSAWIERLAPEPSDALKLAARSQHLRRWEIPRSDFPEGRRGYLAWRSKLAEFHAAESARILRGLGFDDELVERVRAINLKQGLGRDPEVQIMEDALCLAFLEQELEEFSEAHDDDKLVSILKKTWRKMSPAGRRAALGLVPGLSPRLKALIARATAGS